MKGVFPARAAIHWSGVTSTGIHPGKRSHGDLFINTGDPSEYPLLTFEFRLKDLANLRRMGTARAALLRRAGASAFLLFLHGSPEKILLLPKKNHRSVYMHYSGPIRSQGGDLIHLSEFSVKISEFNVRNSAW